MNNKNELLKEEIIRMSGVNPSKCMRCGKCSATCPAYDEMDFHPHQFVSMINDKGEVPLEESPMDELLKIEDTINKKVKKYLEENNIKEGTSEYLEYENRYKQKEYCNYS